MAVKQNVMVVLPALPTQAPPYMQAWWRDVKYSLEQILPVTLTNVNELVDGKFRVLVMQKLAAEPDDIADGWVAFADGVGWNPGSGAGLYERRGGAWFKL
jgi:hypothetical protein